MAKRTTKKRDAGPLEVHILVDRSGSMMSCWGPTISALNEYIGSLEPRTRVSLYLFDSNGGRLDFTTWIADQYASSVRRLDESDFGPRGMTPLHDATGTMLTRIGRPRNRVACVIMTDGQENCSREFSASSVRAMLEERQKQDDWLVIYLGANQDAIREGARFGTSAANSMTYNVGNVGATMKSVSRATSLYASGATAQAAAFTDEEREKAARKIGF